MVDDPLVPGKPLKKCTKAELIDIITFLTAQNKSVMSPSNMEAMRIGRAEINCRESQMAMLWFRLPWEEWRRGLSRH